MAIAYDYDDATVQTLSLSNTADPMRLSARPGRQKCNAIRLTITESSTTEGFRLSGLRLLVAVKGGGGRLPAAQGMI